MLRKSKSFEKTKRLGSSCALHRPRAPQFFDKLGGRYGVRNLFNPFGKSGEFGEQVEYMAVAHAGLVSAQPLYGDIRKQ